MVKLPNQLLLVVVVALVVVGVVGVVVGDDASGVGNVAFASELIFR